jgi:hypothetical protein
VSGSLSSMNYTDSGFGPLSVILTDSRPAGFR